MRLLFYFKKHFLPSPDNFVIHIGNRCVQTNKCIPQWNQFMQDGNKNEKNSPQPL